MSLESEKSEEEIRFISKEGIWRLKSNEVTPEFGHFEKITPLNIEEDSKREKIDEVTPDSGHFEKILPLNIEEDSKYEKIDEEGYEVTEDEEVSDEETEDEEVSECEYTNKSIHVQFYEVHAIFLVFLIACLFNFFFEKLINFI